jgi:xylan 1,4-beta-xylosidase
MTAILLIAWQVSAVASAAEAATDSFPVALRLDAAQHGEELRPIWRFFGADEPNYAYMDDGRKLLAELGELRPQAVYFRAHNLLTSGDGTPALKWGSTGAYSEDAQGKPVYNWTIADRIFDAYRERGVRPYVEIGFMPKDLSLQPEPYQHRWKPGARYEEIYTGWAYPPKDYGKWAELVFAWAKHCVEKYGSAEVESWYWQVWNEPNIGYWRGTPQEFRRLHDHAIDAVRRALPTAKVGGPDTAGGGRFLREFLEHCVRGTNYATEQTGTPLDFVSFHAKGAPRLVDGHVRMGIAEHLRTIDSSFAIIASFPELKAKPIVIGESDPDGCAACSASDYPQNGYRNGTLYSSYTAASFARKHELAGRHGVNLEGALTWAFEFEGQPYFAGFRVLSTNGVALPVLNVFRMFAKMSGRRLSVESDHAVTLDEILKDGVRSRPDVSALASIDKDRLCVLAWHYHDDDVPGPEAEVELTASGLPLANGEARLEHFRIDDEHSNAYAVWRRMGSPERPTSEQLAELEEAGRLAAAEGPRTLRVENGRAALQFRLARQAVALLVLTWQTPAAAGDSLRVTAPPESFFDKVRERDRDAARGFYKKHVDVRGLSVVAAEAVADLALERTAWIVTRMLAGRQDVFEAMVKDGMYLLIIGKDQVYTDMPEYRNHPNPAYQNERVRGTGGKPTSFGEENLLSLPVDRYDDESIGVHEFCHTIDGALRSLDAAWPERRNAVYRRAVAAGLWTNTYAGSNPGEYWAEVCQSYFDCNRVNNWNHGPIGTREQLKLHDPDGYELVRSTFNLSPEQDWRYSWLEKLPNVTVPPEKLAIDPFYTRFTWARELSVLGRAASDEALLKANDTIRKMFAYRHDILKALIADGVRLVVLGKGEKLSDLPEYPALREVPGFDALARSLDYTAQGKLLAVGEENVLADPKGARVGGCGVIRALAKSLYHVTGTRPVDPDWENRGRAVQQYELRVTRLDVRFDEKLKQIYEAALAKGLWKGTAAARDRVEYWAQGVLAYFDAAGEDAAPGGAAHPIVTREMLKEYDPDLHALVDETMAYGGHVDWRYKP